MHHDLTSAVPPGILDYLIVAISVVVLLVALWLFIRGFVCRGEKDPNHIKRKILVDHVQHPGDEE
jgi:hypothetical protein